MLVLLLDHQSVKKRGGKKEAIRLVGHSSFKIVFILLAKMVVVKM